MNKPKLNFKELYKVYSTKYPELRKFHEQQKYVAYLYLTLTLFTVSFFGLFAIMPTLSTISTLRKQYADKQLVYDNLSTKLQNLQTLDSLYAQNASQITRVNEAIPATAQIPEVIRKIEVLAQRNSLFIAGINTGAIEYFPTAKKTPPLYSYTLNMNLIGSTEDINTFISEVINFDRILSIDTIGTGRTDTSRSEVTITGRVFFYAQ